MHQLLDAVEADVLSEDGALSEHVPLRAPSPWIVKNGEWWPKRIELARVGGATAAKRSSADVIVACVSSRALA